MNAEQEAQIIKQDCTAEMIRARQYDAWKQHGEFRAADLYLRHSANMVAGHRDIISNGRLHLFAGRPVMGKGR